VQTRLAAQGLVDGATGWPSVRRNLNDTSDRMVVLTEDGGPPPEITKAEGIGDTAMETIGVQLRVRGAPRLGDEAAAKAQACLDDLDSLQGVQIGTRVYMSVSAATGEPVFIGFDAKERPEFTVAFRMTALRAP
jgi:hypothetical protein